MNTAKQDQCCQAWDRRLAMKTGWIGLLAAVALIGFGSTHGTQAQNFDYEHGHWAGRADDQLQGPSDACNLSLHNSKGQMVIFRLERSGRLLIGLFGHGWPVDPASSTQFLIMVDHSVIHAGLATISQDGTLFALLRELKLSLNAVSSGTKMNVSWRAQHAVFVLEGAEKAVRFLQRCVDRRGAAVQSPLSASPVAEFCALNLRPKLVFGMNFDIRADRVSKKLSAMVIEVIQPFVRFLPARTD